MWKLILPLLLALSAPSAARAQDDPARSRPAETERTDRAPADASRDFLRIAFNFYQQKDSGGNPALEEDMTVLEPMVLFSRSLSDKWTGTLKLQGDIISAASVEHGKRFPPGTQSGASGDKYFGTDVGAFYAWSDQTRVGGGLSFSTEYDYRSLGAYFKWSHDTDDRNDTFVAKASLFFDTLDLIRFTGIEEGQDDRRSLSLGLGWTHVLGPQTVGTVNWDVTFQNGFLSTPYNSVVAAGTEVAEVLPDSRVRNAFHVRLKHLLWEDFAIEPGIGAYFDDWGAAAFNFELAAAWEASPGNLIVRPSYRFHTQTAIEDFVEPSASAIPEFRTQDSDLADFTSHTFGVKLIFPEARFLGRNMELEIGVDYTIRSDDLDSYSLTVGYQWRF